MIDGRSYCWDASTTLDWDIWHTPYPNHLLLRVYSSNSQLLHSHLTLNCSFQHSVSHQNQTHFTIQYQESILTDSDQPKSTCTLTINQAHTHTVPITLSPAPLYLESHSEQAMTEGDNAGEMVVWLCGWVVVVVSISGIFPMASFASLQLNLLLFLGYCDPATIAANAFMPYYGLLSHLLMTD